MPTTAKPAQPNRITCRYSQSFIALVISQTKACPDASFQDVVRMLAGAGAYV